MRWAKPCRFKLPTDGFILRFHCVLLSLGQSGDIVCHLPDDCRDISGSMMTNRMMTAAECSDAELVSRSLTGDRDAFSLIVSRYQTLICSLAYSRIGNLGQSEDIAQETFITAWKHLRLLREPAKLRAWLCGIVRNRIHKNLRRERLEPAHNAETLEIVHDLPANEVIPSELWASGWRVEGYRSLTLWLPS
jgi:Sigma-70 region 2